MCDQQVPAATNTTHIQREIIYLYVKERKKKKNKTKIEYEQNRHKLNQNYKLVVFCAGLEVNINFKLI